MKVILFIVISALLAPSVSAQSSSLKVDAQKFVLPNGLEVVFNVDKSDPVVAVSITAHVGSAREKAGRTGFAHLFEHLLFLESENLGKGGLDKLSARVGGSGANGSTTNDRTNYFQTVPKDALEKMLWAEADKLGWFINTVTDPVLAKEKQVVKNEKRQSYDNVPYGNVFYVVDKAMCPEDHPYNWQVIGSLDDLDRATLEDVKEFYRRWYVPNNVTLAVSGDFDPAQAKKWVEKYFGEIPRGAEVAPMPKRPCTLGSTKLLYHEDNFATLPDLSMNWSSVPQFDPDSYALQTLAEYLTDGKRAPLYKILVDEKKLTSQVYAADDENELAGKFTLRVRAFADKDLDEVRAAIDEGFARFEKEGVSKADLDRIKAGQEQRFYNRLSSVLGKSLSIAEYNIFAGDPTYAAKDLKLQQAVTPADLKRVYEKYIKGKPFVAASFVPKGKPALALAGSAKAEIVEEKIVQGAEKEVDPNVKATYQRTPSSFDRTVEPPYGPAPATKAPVVWQQRAANGMRVFGIENNEVPLVNFEIVIDGGQLLDDPAKPGVANLVARMMTQGTAKRTPEELEDAIKALGANISVVATGEDIRVSVGTLARNYDATMALVREIVLEPRWDAKEFETTKLGVAQQLRQQASNPNQIAANEFAKLLYGKDSIRAKNILGTPESVAAITLDDLKAFYNKNFSPSVARMHVVGALPQAKIAASLAGLSKDWKAKPVTVPTPAAPARPTASKVYFYDVPDAKQSVIRFGYPALAQTDPDFYPATVANYILGGGGFASRLTQELREGKGYTYGIGSGFSGTKQVGAFSIQSGVRSNVTLESAQLVKQILGDYGATFTDKDLETTKGFLIKSNARAFETAQAKLQMLDSISRYGWRPDYVSGREAVVKAMTVARIREISQKYLDPNKMIWLVVGDAKTQLPRMKELGFGEAVRLN